MELAFQGAVVCAVVGQVQPRAEALVQRLGAVPRTRRRPCLGTNQLYLKKYNKNGDDDAHPHARRKTHALDRACRSNRLRPSKKYSIFFSKSKKKKRWRVACLEKGV